MKIAGARHRASFRLDRDANALGASLLQHPHTGWNIRPELNTVVIIPFQIVGEHQWKAEGGEARCARCGAAHVVIVVVKNRNRRGKSGAELRAMPQFVSNQSFRNEIGAAIQNALREGRG